MLFRSQCAAVAALVVGAGGAAAWADWPQFRGPRHDGISDETGLRTAWDAAPAPLWELKVGDAFSSFAAVGDRLYTCGEKDRKQTVWCLSAETGKVIWTQGFEERYVEPGGMGGNGTRATPTVADGRLYILGALGRLVCMDARDGKELWSAQFSNVPTWGYSASVLVHGNLAISGGGRDDGALVAFDAVTGKLAWKTGDNGAGYATAYPFDFAGRSVIGGFVGDAVLLVDAKSGAELWTLPWKTDYDVNAASLIFDAGHLFLSSGYSTGAALVKLVARGDKLSGEKVWQSKVIMNKFQSSILYGGRLFTSDQRSLKCVDFLSGKEKWSQRGVKDSTLVVAQDHLFLLTESGELQIAPISDSGFQATARFKLLEGRCWAAPVIHRGRLYARSMDKLTCIELKK